MDDLRTGAVLRAARIRRGWRQVDLARRAGVSAATVSRIEAGHLATTTIEIIRRVAAAIDVSLEFQPRSRGADLDRAVAARHAALAEAIIERIRAQPGWLVRPEVSFSIYGERGVVDVLAWHADRRAVLVVELKTALVDIGELLGTLDRKRRLGAAIAATLGWPADRRGPVEVGTWLVVAESMTNRRRMAAHRATFEAALPDDATAIRSWLAGRSPRAAEPPPLRARSFVSDMRPGHTRGGFATRRRVRLPSAVDPAAGRRVIRAQTGPTVPGTDRGPPSAR